MRAGTENVAAIAGFGAAVATHQQSPQRSLSKGNIRDAFFAEIHGATWTVADQTIVLPGHVHLRFPGIDAETMLIRLDRMGISASSGAACSSGSLEPSHVLLACGFSEAEAKEGLRFTFGWPLSVEKAREAALIVNRCAEEIRGASKF